MGAVLTSRAARELILRSPAEFTAHFDLSAQEAARLAAMAGDLAALTPGFVRKRERGLIAAMPVTWSVLAGEADALASDYLESRAPAASASLDALAFADYLVAAVSRLPDGRQHKGVIVDVARLERLRLLVSGTEWPLWPAPDESPLHPRHLDPHRPLRLCPGAAVERFTFDVRTVRAASPAEMLARLRPDQANLLCFQRPGDGEVVVRRIDDESARTVKLIGLRPGAVTAAGLGEPGRSRLAKLAALGVIHAVAP
jgi:hypothetical protein